MALPLLVAQLKCKLEMAPKGYLPHPVVSVEYLNPFTLTVSNPHSYFQVDNNGAGLTRMAIARNKLGDVNWLTMMSPFPGS